MGANKRAQADRLAAVLRCLDEFRQRHGHVYVPRSYVCPVHNLRLGDAVNRFRRDRDKLDEAHRLSLELVPGWSWDGRPGRLARSIKLGECLRLEVRWPGRSHQSPYGEVWVPPDAVFADLGQPIAVAGGLRRIPYPGWSLAVANDRLPSCRPFTRHRVREWRRAQVHAYDDGSVEKGVTQVPVLDRVADWVKPGDRLSWFNGDGNDAPAFDFHISATAGHTPPPEDTRSVNVLSAAPVDDPGPFTRTRDTDERLMHEECMLPWPAPPDEETQAWEVGCGAGYEGYTRIWQADQRHLIGRIEQRMTQDPAWAAEMAANVLNGYVHSVLGRGTPVRDTLMDRFGQAHYDACRLLGLGHPALAGLGFAVHQWLTGNQPYHWRVTAASGDVTDDLLRVYRPLLTHDDHAWWLLSRLTVRA